MRQAHEPLESGYNQHLNSTKMETRPILRMKIFPLNLDEFEHSPKIFIRINSFGKESNGSYLQFETLIEWPGLTLLYYILNMWHQFGTTLLT